MSPILVITSSVGNEVMEISAAFETLKMSVLIMGLIVPVVIILALLRGSFSTSLSWPSHPDRELPSTARSACSAAAGLRVRWTELRELSMGN